MIVLQRGTGIIPILWRRKLNYLAKKLQSWDFSPGIEVPESPLLTTRAYCHYSTKLSAWHLICYGRIWYRIKRASWLLSRWSPGCVLWVNSLLPSFALENLPIFLLYHSRLHLPSPWASFILGDIQLGLVTLSSPWPKGHLCQPLMLWVPTHPPSCHLALLSLFIQPQRGWRRVQRDPVWAKGNLGPRPWPQTRYIPNPPFCQAPGIKYWCI